MMKTVRKELFVLLIALHTCVSMLGILLSFSFHFYCFLTLTFQLLSRPDREQWNVLRMV